MVKEFIIEKYNKHKEIILYALFGVLTTIANFLTFWGFTELLGEEWFLVNNAVAWVAGVLVAFVTNKLWVFNSKSWKISIALKEFFEFTIARVFSFFVEEFGMWLFITVLHFSDKSLSLFAFSVSGQIIVKLLLSVIVVIMNYFFSKFIIFKKKK